MDMDTKYITEQGHTVRRISESQVAVKKKAAPVPSNPEKGKSPYNQYRYRYHQLPRKYLFIRRPIS